MRKNIEQDEDEFESKNACVRLYTRSLSYRSEESILSISNTPIVLEILNFIEDKIKTKISDIEQELIK
jgi:hypothetical protein